MEMNEACLIALIKEFTKGYKGLREILNDAFSTGYLIGFVNGEKDEANRQAERELSQPIPEYRGE